MALIQIDHNPSDRSLHWFGGLLGLFFFFLGAMAYWRFGAPTVAWVFWIAALVIVPVYFAVPRLRIPLYLGWMYAVYPIGLVVSYVILAMTYFVVLMPIGLVMRLCGRDPLKRSLDRKASSYWVPHRPATDQRRYFQQF